MNHNVTALGDVNIYPNPSSNLVTISNVNFDLNQIKIISTNGVDFTNQLKLDGIQNNGNQISVDIISLKPGSYIIWIQDVSYLFIKE